MNKLPVLTEMPDTSGFEVVTKVRPMPPIQSTCANGCGKILEGLLIGGTCCSKKCGDELKEDIEATLQQDEMWEHMSDAAHETILDDDME